MKRTLLTLLAALALLPALADEGMWLPSLISERIDDMRAKGFRLTAEDIYSINKASMKDAVVLFNGGCTGELISPEGLPLTNHHCGYDAIQKHSTVEHDYLTNGFWAMSRAEELPNEKLWVRFLVRMEEVTDRIAAGETAAQIVEKAKAEGTGYKASVEQMYYGNQQFLFVYEQFDDVRLVAAPPLVDRQVRRRHRQLDLAPPHGRFLDVPRLRFEGQPSGGLLAPERPLPSEKHFSISTKGVKEGDFTMIYGFPGNTQEYILSDAVAYIAERSDPAKIAVRTGRLDIITKAQESDPAPRIHYAAKHASIANAWKKWQGEALGIDRRGTVAAKFDYETQFGLWSVGRPEYAGVVMGLRAEYDRIMDAYFAYEITRETLSTLPAAYTPEERSEECFARRKFAEQALWRHAFREYGRCPKVYRTPSYAEGMARYKSPEAYADALFEAVWEGSDSVAMQPAVRLREETKRMLDHISWMLGTKSLRATSTAKSSTNFILLI